MLVVAQVVRTITEGFNTQLIKEEVQVNDIYTKFFAEEQSEIARQNSPLSFLGALVMNLADGQPAIEYAVIKESLGFNTLKIEQYEVILTTHFQALSFKPLQLALHLIGE